MKGLQVSLRVKSGCPLIQKQVLHYCSQVSSHDCLLSQRICSSLIRDILHASAQGMLNVEMDVGLFHFIAVAGLESQLYWKE